MHRYAELVYIWIFWVVDSECWLWIWTCPVNLSLIWIATEPVITLLLLSICDSTTAFPHLRVVPVRGLAVVHSSVCSVRRGQQTRVIERGLYVESLTAGTHEVHGRTQGKFLLIKLKKIPPPDSWDPPAVSSHGRKCLLIMQKKLFLPLTAGMLGIVAEI